MRMSAMLSVVVVDLRRFAPPHVFRGHRRACGAANGSLYTQTIHKKSRQGLDKVEHLPKEIVSAEAWRRDGAGSLQCLPTA